MLKRSLSELARECSGRVLVDQSHRLKHSMRQIYRPVSVVQDSARPASPKSADSNKNVQLSRSQKLMADLGLISVSPTNGAFHLLPVAMKSLDKLIRIVEHFMAQGECQKIQMPTLTSTALWKQSGRLEDKTPTPELMTTTDRHNREYILSPTHEEAVCDMVTRSLLSYKQLPLKLYQITGKFRDEMKPRFGLLRGREFIMKDLYTFDKDVTESKATYEEINNIYTALFRYIGVGWLKARGSSGTIGGDISHEFHLISDIGEDQVLACENCGDTFNEELMVERSENVKAAQGVSTATNVSTSDKNLSCTTCGSQKLSKTSAIEVGHTFLLGTKYSKPLNTTFVDIHGKPQPAEMGCYGLGVSRILAAVVEVLSKQDEIRWPLPLAPYLIAIVPPKAGSKEEQLGAETTLILHSHLNTLLPNDILLDDRTELTIGKRVRDLKMLGIPYIIVLGKRLAETPGIVEIQDVNSGAVFDLEQSNVLSYFTKLRKTWNFL